MPFVKLDTGILDSTLWIERECREIFITALLMAVPREFNEPQPQIEIGTMENTGFVVPPGWYGFVPAASYGIIGRALIDRKLGLAALERLGNPEYESRSKDFDGRRLVRVDGGFVVLNYMKYRDRDYTSSDRSRRYRDRKSSRRDDTVSQRDITQAEAEAEADKDKYIGSREQSSPEPVRVVFNLPLVSREIYGLPEDLYKTYKTAYPGVNIMTELAKMKAWLESNPLKKKTAKGMPRFMNTWLEKAQNSGSRPVSLFNQEPEPRRIKNTVGVPRD